MALAGETIYASDALTGAWQAWTPSWTASTGTPAVGTGTLTGRYKQVGNTVFFNMVLTWGSTTTAGGTGLWQFSLPIQAADAFAAAVAMRDQSAGTNFAGAADCRAGSVATAITRIGWATATVMSTNPFTWATTDVLKVSGVYEAA